MDSAGDQDIKNLMDNVHLIHCSEAEGLLHAVRYSLPALVERLEETSMNSEKDAPHAMSSKSPTTIDQTGSGNAGENPVKLVVIDSIAAPFRGSEASSSTLPSAVNSSGSRHIAQRTRDLAEIAHLLYRLAQRHDLAVVIINQVSDVFSRADQSLPSPYNDGFGNPKDDMADCNGLPLDYRHYSHVSRFFSGEDAGSGEKMAVFGLAWTKCINSRIMLSRTGRRRRKMDGAVVLRTAGIDEDGAEVNGLDEGTEEVRRADVVFSPFCERGSIEYALRQQGLVAIGEHSSRPRAGKAGISNTTEKAKVLHTDEDEEGLWEAYALDIVPEELDLQEGQESKNASGTLG